MNILIIGKGGREHALCWAANDDPKVTHIYAYPGNPGIKELNKVRPIALEQNLSHEDLAQWAIKTKVDLTIVGPEDPLNTGIVDVFLKNGLKIFGPTKAAAQLESSKYFAKKIMQRASIPTGSFEVAHSYEQASSLSQSIKNYPQVLKYDGLAAGKGVVICQSTEEALEFSKKVFNDKIFGDDPGAIIFEEFLEGPELSYFALCHNEKFFFFGDAQDHKRLLNDDKGPNTGGMGAYTPTQLMPDDLKHTIEETIVQPLLDQMLKESHPYSGFLYVGMILTQDGPKVLEFNVRLGDPEAQCLLHRLQSPLAQTCLSILNQSQTVDIEWDERKSFVLTLASEHYPFKSSKPQRITIQNDDLKNCRIYHCGTDMDEDGFIATGGRVLSIASLGKSYKDAAKLAYTLAKNNVIFEGMQYRTDIGHQAIKNVND